MNATDQNRTERAERECRDRECTEADVRARLADAEATLARVRSALLMGGQTPAINARAAIAVLVEWEAGR